MFRALKVTAPPEASEGGTKHTQQGTHPQALAEARQVHLRLFFQNKTKNHHSKHLRRVLKLKALWNLQPAHHGLVVRNGSSGRRPGRSPSLPSASTAVPFELRSRQRGGQPRAVAEVGSIRRSEAFQFSTGLLI